jgi:uroporphyrinogen-III decarboxylase
MQLLAKNIWADAIAMKPLERIPFWPKLWTEYPGKQKPPFCEMDLKTLHGWIGSDYCQMPNVPGCVKAVRRETSIEKFQDGDNRITVFRTPRGEMKSICRWDARTSSGHPVEHPVKGLDDIKRMIEFCNDAEMKLNEEALAAAQKQAAELGDDAFIAACCGTSPLMEWVENTAGIEMSHFLLADHEELVEELFAAMQRNMRKTVSLFAEHHPADILFFNENTSTTLISPTQYRTYCFVHISEYAKILRRHGRRIFLHMCGHLKDILPDLARLDVDAFEAFTSPTLGNTTLLDGRTAAPKKCLVGGTNAILWTKSPEEIIGTLKTHLDELPHHRGVVVTSGGAMPPLAIPETIRQVCEWLKQYPARM